VFAANKYYTKYKKHFPLISYADSSVFFAQAVSANPDRCSQRDVTAVLSWRCKTKCSRTLAWVLECDLSKRVRLLLVSL